MSFYFWIMSISCFICNEFYFTFFRTKSSRTIGMVMFFTANFTAFVFVLYDFFSIFVHKFCTCITTILCLSACCFELFITVRVLTYFLHIIFTFLYKSCRRLCFLFTKKTRYRPTPIASLNFVPPRLAQGPSGFGPGIQNRTGHAFCNSTKNFSRRARLAAITIQDIRKSYLFIKNFKPLEHLTIFLVFVAKNNFVDFSFGVYDIHQCI